MGIEYSTEMHNVCPLADRSPFEFLMKLET
jgi:hypothetical protein